MSGGPTRPAGDGQLALYAICLLAGLQVSCAGCRDRSGAPRAPAASEPPQQIAEAVAPRRPDRGEPREAADTTPSGVGLASAVGPGRACSGRAARPAVLCVDARAEGPGDGSAMRPFASIQAAIDAARTADEVQVAAGVYREHLRINEKGPRLRGGFRGLTTRGSPGRSVFALERAPATSTSVIEGSRGGAVLTLVRARGALVEGFHIRGGTGHLEGERGSCCAAGGGLYLSEGSARIAHNLIERNDLVRAHSAHAHETAGAALFAENATLELVENVIRDNRAGHGAVAVNGGKVLIQGNLIANNLAVGDHGGGLYLSGPALRVLGNRILDNRLEPHNGEGGWGGGLIAFGEGTVIWLEGNEVRGNYAPEIGSGTFIDDGARATLRNEVIAANRCSRAGSGLYVDGLDAQVRSSAALENVTIAGHRCPGAGHGIYLENASVTVTNSIIWQNGDDFQLEGKAQLDLRYTISEERRPGVGNLQLDPLFAAPPADVHLRSQVGRFAPGPGPGGGSWVRDERTSPAIDAGDPAQPVGDEPPPHGGRRNLGAYGGTAQASRSR